MNNSISKNQMIQKQLEALPEKSGIVVHLGEMIKDLSEVMADDEVVEGVVTACEKKVTHFLKNSKMIRSFMAVTNKNVYVLTRGRQILNLVNALDKNIIIPRNEIISVSIKDKIPVAFKLWYSGEMSILTTNGQYEFYMGPGFKRYLPRNFFEMPGEITPVPSEIDSSADRHENPYTEDKKSYCPDCGTELSKGAKFCKECGTPVPEIQLEKQQYCPLCGTEVEGHMKFCPKCGGSLHTNSN